MGHEHLYTDNVEVIDAVLASICRRHRLPADQAEEFASRLRLKLVEHDYHVLRQFQGRSSLRTFLAAVAERALLDWRIAEWGKWRPCAEARRLGGLAVELDRLLTRDRVPFDQAVEVLASRGYTATRAELDALRVRLSDRVGRRTVSAEVLESMPAPGPPIDDDHSADEIRRRAARAAAALAAALALLPPQDQVILRMRFQDGLTVARIAQLIGEEQKPLYRRFDRLLAELRASMRADEVTDEEVAGLFGHPAAELSGVFEPARPPDRSPPGRSGPAAGTRDAGPSRRLTTGGEHA